MTTIELLEDRIANLEKCIYGLVQTNGIDNTTTENPVIDSLLHVNTLILSALSGREKANIVIKRLPELNSYLDTAVENSKLDINAIGQLLLTLKPEIQQNFEMLNQMQELMPVLETDDLTDLPDLEKKFYRLDLSYLKIDGAIRDLKDQMDEVIFKYNELIASVSKSLITMDAAVTAAEIAAMPKKEED
ncbi:dynactin subunit 3 [Ptiloglossa arizonensis]|uniref:dynactin subunit 3 n=1 Tax=Ptiloglossa arizonensis TaxID=3350558 RepID=UPI003F9F6A21